MGPGMFDGFKEALIVVFVGCLLFGACCGVGISRSCLWVRDHVRIEVTR